MCYHLTLNCALFYLSEKFKPVRLFHPARLLHAIKYTLQVNTFYQKEKKNLVLYLYEATC